MSRNKAKLTEEQYEEIYSELSRASDSLESESVFGTFANKYPHVKSIKNSFLQKARWKAKAGDNSWRELYNRLQPGKINLEDKLTSFSKKQVLQWIMELTNFREDQREFVKGTLEGGSNDRFFEKMLAEIVEGKINEYDEKWMLHRDNIHTKWKRIGITYQSFLYVLFGTITLWGYSLLTGMPSILPTAVLTSITILLLVAISYKGIADNIDDGLYYEERLIEETKHNVMTAVPKEILNMVINTNYVESFDNVYINGKPLTPDVDDTSETGAMLKEMMKEAKEMDLTKDVDFAVQGLMQWMSDSHTLYLPGETSRWYRFIYNRVRGERGFVDYDSVKDSQIADFRDGLYISPHTPSRR